MPASWLAMVVVVATSAGGAPARGSRDGGSNDASGLTSGTSTIATEVAFDTTLEPRIDPMFVDARGLRDLIDQFSALDTEMKKVRDDFSTAVQLTLATLPRDAKRAGTSCPEGAKQTYARALAAGGQYLAHGRKLEALFRQIKRADDQSETLGLTPDYRQKARVAREGFRALLSDYREMRVAFYEQLGAELRHVGCDLKALAAGAYKPSPVGAAAVDPADASSWVLEVPDSARSARASEPAPHGHADPSQTPGQSSPAIWITVDNGDCHQETRVVLDDSPVLTAPGRKQLPIRTHAGPHQICALPADDPRNCGQPGTVRKAYLHEGWTLTLHCRRP